MAIEGVAVQTHLGIHRGDAVVGGLQHRVDLEQGGIAALIGLVEGGHELHHLLAGLAREAQVAGDLLALEGAQAHAGVHLLAEDLVGALLGHLLDVHAALGAVHDDVATLPAVQEHAHVILLRLALAGVVHVLGDQHLVHLLPFGRGLGRLQHHADDVARPLLHLIEALGQFHPAALTAAPGVDLRLHHPPFGAGVVGQPFGLFHGLVGVVGHQAALNGDAMLLEDLLALVLVQVHRLGGVPLGGCESKPGDRKPPGVSFVA